MRAGITCLIKSEPIPIGTSPGSGIVTDQYVEKTMLIEEWEQIESTSVDQRQ